MIRTGKVTNVSSIAATQLTASVSPHVLVHRVAEIQYVRIYARYVLYYLSVQFLEIFWPFVSSIHFSIYPTRYENANDVRGGSTEEVERCKVVLHRMQTQPYTRPCQPHALRRRLHGQVANLHEGLDLRQDPTQPGIVLAICSRLSLLAAASSLLWCSLMCQEISHCFLILVPLLEIVTGCSPISSLEANLGLGEGVH